MFGWLLCLPAQALVLQATATDITDTVAGQDRWQMRYRVTGELPAFYSLTLFFPTVLPTALYADLANASAPPPLIAALSSDVGFDGALILTAISDLAAGQSVDALLDFTLLGGLPFAPQAFEVADDNFGIVDGGMLTIGIAPANTVPEPASWMLLGAGLMALRSRRAPMLR